MVVSYWDMAAGFVNHGAIDEEMFIESNGECVSFSQRSSLFWKKCGKIMGSPKGSEKSRNSDDENA